MNPTYHDREICSVSFDPERKILSLGLDSEEMIIFEQVEYFDFTPFDFQNVIFELNIYLPSTLPVYIADMYGWLSNYKNDPDCRYCVIQSSTGMDGIIVFRETA